MIMATNDASMKTMAQSLVVTAKEAARNGFAPDDVYRYRLATCFSCEHYIHKTKRCSKCGCFMAWKARVAGDPTKLCPLNIWER